MESTTPIVGADNSIPTSQNFLNGKSLAEVESALKGENPYTFRLAEQRLESHSNYPSVRVTNSERTFGEMASIEPTFTQHEPITGVPFAASLFKLDRIYKDIEPADRSHIQKIDNYIRERVNSGKVSDNAQAVASLIKTIEKQINLKDYHDPFYKAERIAAYLDTMKKYNSANTLKARVTKEAPQADKVNILKKTVLSLIKAL